MRRSILALVAAASLMSAPGAIAAPTCKDASGDTIRCATPGAMPVGWSLSAGQLLERPTSPGPSLGELIGLFAVLGGFFALIALMPEFDGARGAGWDRQEDDDEEPG